LLCARGITAFRGVREPAVRGSWWTETAKFCAERADPARWLFRFPKNRRGLSITTHSPFPHPHLHLHSYPGPCAGRDVSDFVVGLDVALAVAVVVAAVASARAVPLPIESKLTRNTRCRCVEETFHMLGKQGHRDSA